MTVPHLLYLTGYRGTGKTSVGAVLARRLGVPLIDLDRTVEQAAGRTIREIFAAGGEEAFRDAESESLAKIAREEHAVVALGGGAILRPINRQQIRDSGRCFWLDADANTLVQRITADTTTTDSRPALTRMDPRDEIRELMTIRRPLYQEVSDHRIDTVGKTVEQVADEIVEWLGSRKGVRSQ